MQGETINKIRIPTRPDSDSNNESIDSQNITHGSSPTTPPCNSKYSSPTSIMSINSNTQLQKHLSPKNSNGKNNLRPLNTRSVPIIDMSELLDEDIALNNHTIATPRNEISERTTDIYVITIDVLTERTIQANDNDETDNETNNDCKIICTNHS
eukprot:299174_1